MQYVKHAGLESGRCLLDLAGQGMKEHGRK